MPPRSKRPRENDTTPRPKHPRENDDHVEGSARSDRTVSAVDDEAMDDAMDARAREDEPATRVLEGSTTPDDSRLAELEKALSQFTSRFEGDDDDECRESAVEAAQAIDNAMSSLHAARQTMRELHERAEEIFDEMEADIVAQAGRPGMVTIATNMAGRGTDIVLGGNITSLMKAIEEEKTIKPSEQKVKIDKLKSDWMLENKKVIEAGGLHIIGTERHESRRIDNQLRGRAGRQGDPGSSRFYLAMDDSLLRIFAGEKMKTIMDKLGVPKGEPIEAGMVSRSIESAQRKVENRNFDIRKQLLEFDNVSNEQRKILYQQRKEVLESESLEELAKRHVLVVVLAHDLGNRHLKVLLCHVHATLTERIHARLCAHRLDFSARGPWQLLGDFCQVDPPHQVHLP